MVGFDVAQPLVDAMRAAAGGQHPHVVAGLVGKAHRGVGRAAGLVARIVDAVGIAGAVLLAIAHRQVVAHRVGDPVERPQPDLRAAVGLDRRIGAVAVLHDLARLGADLEPGRAAAGAALRDDLAEAVDPGAVFGAVGAVDPAHRDQALAVEAETVVRVVGNRAPLIVLGLRPGTADDRRQPAQRPARAEQPVAAVAAVDQR